MCVLYVGFGSKIMPRTFECVAMRSAVLFILRSRLLLHSAGSGVNRVHIVLSGFSVRLFCPGKNFMYVWLYVFLGCTRALGGGMSAVYMLNNVGERMPPC